MFKSYTRIFVLTAIFIIPLMAAMAAPKITCENKVWEFPKVKEGETIKHKYVIKNAGDEELEIKKVRGSCGCTAATPESKKVKPGEATNIQVKFNTSNRPGKQTKYVYVYSNDPETRLLKLKITGEVEKVPKPKILVRPFSWNMQTVKPGQIEKTAITINNAGEKDLIIKSITTSKQNLTANLVGSKTIPPGGKGNLELTFTPHSIDPRIREHVTIESNDPRRKRYVFRVIGRSDYEMKGVNVSVMGIRPEKDDEAIIDLHLNNLTDQDINVTIPDASKPNEIAIPANKLRKFSVRYPIQKLKMDNKSKSSAKTPEPRINIELSVPITGASSILSLDKENAKKAAAQKIENAEKELQNKDLKAE